MKTKLISSTKTIYTSEDCTRRSVIQEEEDEFVVTLMKRNHISRLFERIKILHFDSGHTAHACGTFDVRQAPSG